MRPCGGVLLAGGASRRMGRDKALLPLADGRLLWQRQWAVLEELELAELYFSGPARDGLPASLRRIEDETPGGGPLSGVVAALRVLQAPHLLILAIDLPLMTAAFLRGLLGKCAPGRGIVPCHAGGRFYEPLAAVYPRECLPLAERRLAGADRSMQTFVREAGALVQTQEIAPEELSLFSNWNAPSKIR